MIQFLTVGRYSRYSSDMIYQSKLELIYSKIYSCCTVVCKKKKGAVRAQTLFFGPLPELLVDFKNQKICKRLQLLSPCLVCRKCNSIGYGVQFVLNMKF